MEALQILSKPGLQMLNRPIFTKRVDIDLGTIVVTLLEDDHEILNHIDRDGHVVGGIQLGKVEERGRFTRIDRVVELKQQHFQILGRLNSIIIDFAKVL